MFQKIPENEYNLEGCNISIYRITLGLKITCTPTESTMVQSSNVSVHILKKIIQDRMVRNMAEDHNDQPWCVCAYTEEKNS